MNEEQAKKLREGIDYAIVAAGYETPCWLWRHAGGVGYGTARVGGRTVNAHRLAYEAFVGPVPEGLELDHLCRVRRCVNPNHLEPVTRSENMRRGSRGRLTRAEAQMVAHSVGPAAPIAALFGVRRGYVYNLRCRKATT